METGRCRHTPGAGEGCGPGRGREAKGDKTEATDRQLPPSCCRRLSHSCEGDSATCPRPALSHTCEGDSATCPGAGEGLNEARCSQHPAAWRGVKSASTGDAGVASDAPELLLV